MSEKLNQIIKNAKLQAKKDGYDQVIILDNDGNYSFSRKYEGCCPEWYGKIVGNVVVNWNNGVKNITYSKCTKRNCVSEIILRK